MPWRPGSTPAQPQADRCLVENAGGKQSHGLYCQFRRFGAANDEAALYTDLVIDALQQDEIVRIGRAASGNMGIDHASLPVLGRKRDGRSQPATPELDQSPISTN